MGTVTFIADDGETHEVEVPDGESLMEAATANLVPGIDGDCGGVCACATCHVHVEPAWADRLAGMGDDEDTMLELADARDERSRLGCQIRMSPELDGITVRLPLGQH